MKPSLFGKIQSQWDSIVQNLDVKRVCDILMTKLTLIPDDLLRIKSQVTQNDKAWELLEILKVKEDKHFENFLAALDGTDHKYIADAIRQAEVPDDYMELAYSGATASTSSSYNTRKPHNVPVNTISSLRPCQKGKDCTELTMAGKHIPTEAKKKHNSLCIKLDGLITKDSIESIKRMALTYIDRKLVDKADTMNKLLHLLEVKGVLAVGKYDILIELMESAGIGIGIDDIKATDIEIQNIMQNSIHRQVRVKKTKEKAVYTKLKKSEKPSPNKRRSKGKAPLKGTVKKKSISKDPGTTYSGATASTSSSYNTRKPHNVPVNTISSLRPCQKGWRICARVTNKNRISKYKIYGGWDQRFNVSFADDSGSIEAVAFGEAVDKFYELLEEQKVYYISGATIKKANSKFSQGNACDLILENDTNIELCVEEDKLDLPTEISYNFVGIDKLEPGRSYDVIGVVKDHQVKTIGKWSRIEVQIVDQSKNMVPLTLSMKDVENLDLSGNPVIAVKGAWLKNSNGHIYLKKMPNTKIKINPERRETDLLLRWFAREGHQNEFEKI